MLTHAQFSKGWIEHFAWKLKIWFLYSPAAHSVWCRNVFFFLLSIKLSITRFTLTLLFFCGTTTREGRGCFFTSRGTHYLARQQTVSSSAGKKKKFFVALRQSISLSQRGACVLGCVSLLSLSSLLLCISLGNDFGDASSPLTATLAS